MSCFLDYMILILWASLVVQWLKKKKKKPTCSAGDTGDVGLIPGLGRSEMYNMK